MKVVRTIVVALVLVVLAAAAALYINPPVGWLLNQAVAQFKQQTGRDLTIAGERSLKLGVTSTLRLEDVTIAAAGAGEPPLKAKVVEADFESLPLLARRLVAGQIRLDGAVIALAPAAAPTRSGPASSGDAATGSKPRFAIRELVINNATVSWRDGPGATPIVAEDINLRAESVVAGEPLAAAFDFVYRGEKVSGTTRVEAPETLASGGSSAVNVKLTTARGSLDADGEATAAGEPRFTGKGTAVTRSLRELAQWMGHPLPAGKGLEQARASGNVTVDAKRLQLANARIVVDETAATGNVAIELPPRRLKLTGKLDADKLDTGRYVEAARGEPQAAVRRSRAPAFTIEQVPLKESLKSYLAATARGAQPEAAMLEAAGIDTRRAPASDPWSDEPLFETDGLKAMDADLDLSIKKLTVRGIDVGLPRLKVALNAGELMLDAPQIETGNGGLGATLRVDGRQPVPVLAGTVKLDELEVRDLLGEVGLESYVAGQVSGEGQFKAQGRSQRELVRSLDGSVKALIPRGSVVGWDVWSVVKNFGRLGPFDEDKRVPLDRVNANLVVAKGVARSQAVEAGGSVLRLTGEATARLPARDLQTQARVRLLSLPVLRPIAVQVGGPWDQLKITWGWDSVFGGTRGDPVQSPVGVVDGLDLKDPEIASLLRQAIERQKSTRAVNEVAVEAMTELLAKAEGR